MSRELVPSNGPNGGSVLALRQDDPMAGATLNALVGIARKLDERIVEVRGLVQNAAVPPAPRATPPPAPVVSRTPVRRRMHEIVD